MLFGGRKKLSIGMITGIPASIDNKYVPGSGVGATNASIRRAKYLHSTHFKSVAEPSAPSSLSYVVGDGYATVSFTPENNGGSLIKNYLYSIDGGATFTPFNPAVTTSPVVIDGLQNGIIYYLQLKALNCVGAGSASSTLSIISAGMCFAPTSLSASAANNSAIISFVDPSNNGGTAITNYQYSINGGVTFTDFSPAVTSSPVTITGLTNGTLYNIQLKPVNSAGPGVASSSVFITPATTPNAPTSLSGTAGNNSATISFTRPSSTGGKAITNYKYSTDGGATFTSFSPAVTSSPVVITGLTNGNAYTIQLQAVNAIGAGTASASVSVTPATTPGAPTTLSGTAGNNSATISFTIPTSNGGRAITNYQYSTDGGSSFTAFSPAVTSSPVVITGLTNGNAYTILLKAVNSIGAGTASSSVSVTPATTPGAPTSLSGTAGNTSATVSFTTPTSNGGSSITNYQYSTNGGSSFTAFSPAVTSSPVTISGLTNGTSYNIQLKAVNSIGAGTASASTAVTPATTPGVPTSLSAVARNNTATITFSAPSSNGGSAITNYQYSTDGGSSFTAFSPAVTSSPVTITGLTNNTTYSVQLKAVNSMGVGAATTSLSVTPKQFTPLAGGVVFNNTNKLALSPGVAMGAGAYTVEGWFYNNGSWPTTAPYPAVLGFGTHNELLGLAVFFVDDKTIMTDRNGGGWRPTYQFPTSMTLNAWHHFALVRDSNMVETAFLDGVKATSAGGLTGNTVIAGQQTNSANYSGHTDEVGHFYQGNWSGYLTNIRLVSGSAVYDPTASSITTPNQPLTAVSGTQYLMLGADVTTDTAGVQTVTNVGSVTQSSTAVPF